MKTGPIVTWALGILITALYGYAVVIAVGNLLGMIEQGQLLGLNLSLLGATLLAVGLAAPPVVYAIALWLGRKRRAALRILLLAAGLCLVGVVQLDIIDLVTRVIPPASLYESLL